MSSVALVLVAGVAMRAIAVAFAVTATAAAAPLLTTTVPVIGPIVPIVFVAMVGGAQAVAARPPPSPGGVVRGAELPFEAGPARPSVAASAAALVDGRVVDDRVEVDENAVQRPVAPLLRRRALRQISATHRRPVEDGVCLGAGD
jgi:hypothetical protein